jgi:hypothetical protein
MSETYETIGVAVRQHDAIRLSIKTGEQHSYFIAAEAVARLFDRATVALYRLRLVGDYVTPEPVPDASVSISSTGKTVIVEVGTDQMLIPTRQLQVHYERAMGETSKIIRRIERAPAPSAVSSAPMRMAVV